MMFQHCPDCATPVREGLAFCVECGALMPHPVRRVPRPRRPWRDVVRRLTPTPERLGPERLGPDELGPEDEHA
jgi:hypothetical protein